MLNSTVQIIAVPPNSDDAVRLIRALDDDLRRRYPGITLHGLRAEDVRDHRLAFLVAHADGEAIGCGAVRELEASVGEKIREVMRGLEDLDDTQREAAIDRLIQLSKYGNKIGWGYGDFLLETAAALQKRQGAKRLFGTSKA
jgi:hypothetical protein